MKIVVPERVVEVALSTMHKLMDEGLGVGKVSTEATITAALQGWIASGEAQAGELFVSDIDKSWSARADEYTELRKASGYKLPQAIDCLIIRMEPDND